MIKYMRTHNIEVSNTVTKEYNKRANKYDFLFGQ
jgi:hypothetical protein